MRYLIVILSIVAVSCSTQPTNCDKYTLQEHKYYNGDGYSVFTNESDSLAVFLNQNEISQYNEGSRYTLCFGSDGVTIK